MMMMIIIIIIIIIIMLLLQAECFKTSVQLQMELCVLFQRNLL